MFPAHAELRFCYVGTEPMITELCHCPRPAQSQLLSVITLSIPWEIKDQDIGVVMCNKPVVIESVDRLDFIYSIGNTDYLSQVITYVAIVMRIM